MTRRLAALPPWLPRWTLLILSLVGWGLFGRALLINVLGSITLVDEEIGGLGRDTYAYWLAGTHIVEGEPLYGIETIDELGAYLYPPPFAQLWVPLSFLPGLLVDWGWRILGILSIRYMAGSWQIAGLWWLYPGTIIEITAGNVTFQMAALTVAGLRGRAEGIFPAAIVKFSAVAVVPFIWLRRPQARRGLVVGGVIAAGAVGLSVLLGPDLWREYLGDLGGQGSLSMDHPSIIHILPTPAVDFLLRIAIAAAIVVASVRYDSPHLAYVAAFLITPVIWVQKLCALLALLTLENDDWLKPYRWPWGKKDAAASDPDTATEVPV